MDAECIIHVIAHWIKAEPAIEAVAVVGSHARSAARVDSDIDLVLLTTDPSRFRTDASWLDAIEWSGIGTRPIKWEDEDYGVLWSRRLWLARNAGEVEFGFASPAWADINPIDPGTRRVIAGGCRILHDPTRILNRVCTFMDGLARWNKAKLKIYAPKAPCHIWIV